MRERLWNWQKKSSALPCNSVDNSALHWIPGPPFLTAEQNRHGMLHFTYSDCHTSATGDPSAKERVEPSRHEGERAAPGHLWRGQHQDTAPWLVSQRRNWSLVSVPLTLPSPGVSPSQSSFFIFMVTPLSLTVTSFRHESLNYNPSSTGKTSWRPVQIENITILQHYNIVLTNYLIVKNSFSILEPTRTGFRDRKGKEDWRDKKEEWRKGD